MGHSDSFLLGRVFMYGPLSWHQPSTFSLTGSLVGNSNCKTQKRRKGAEKVYNNCCSVNFIHTQIKNFVTTKF